MARISCPRPKALEVGLAAVGKKPLSRLMIHFSGFFRVDRQLDLVVVGQGGARHGDQQPGNGEQAGE